MRVDRHEMGEKLSDDTVAFFSSRLDNSDEKKIVSAAGAEVEEWLIDAKSGGVT